MTIDSQVHFKFSWKGPYTVSQGDVTAIHLEDLWMNINRRWNKHKTQMLVLNKEGILNISNGLEGATHTVPLKEANALKLFARIFPKDQEEPLVMEIPIKRTPIYESEKTYFVNLGSYHKELRAKIEEENQESDDESSSDILSLSSEEDPEFSSEVFSSSFDKH